MVSEGAAFDATRDMFPHPRVARPRAEGRGRNQLRPRYWPRITDQELQQISGGSNSTIVPLFEKLLSASDAGRIGRLVLPKACAEAYLPPISQPEGRPLTIQDARGKEWHFQFKFWPNNGSRMYVLEGVTPCIQSLQLQAGDAVTFSRIDPGGKLVMGFRKPTNTVSLPDSQISAIANGSLLSETLFSTANENIGVVSGYPGFCRSIKGAANLHPSTPASRMVFPSNEAVANATHKRKIRKPSSSAGVNKRKGTPTTTSTSNTVSSRSGTGSNDPCSLQIEQPPIVHQDIGSYEASVQTVQTPKKKHAPKRAPVEIANLAGPASNTRSKKKLQLE